MRRTSRVAAVLVAAALLAAARVEGRPSDAPQAPSDEEVQRAAMSRLAFMAGQWIGEGWFGATPDQRVTSSMTELYAFRGNGLILDGEGFFRVNGPESRTDYGLGMLFFDRTSGQYKMWHCCSGGRDMVVTLEVDLEAQSARYLATDSAGRPYRFGWKVGADGEWVTTQERRRPDGSWYTVGEFRMRKVK